MSVGCFIIDPQRTFCEEIVPELQQRLHTGELCVEGGWDDMKRVADFVEKRADDIDELIISGDQHPYFHISHNVWFYNIITLENPNPFTTMKVINGHIMGYENDQFIGEFTTVNPEYLERTLNYINALQAMGKKHIVWPVHGLNGTVGQSFVPRISEAAIAWAVSHDQNATIVNKGSNPFTEHWSAIRAEVIDPEDKGTENQPLILAAMAKHDILLWSGEALSHCLGLTIEYGVEAFPDPDAILAKSILFIDGTSNVPGFQAVGDTFLAKWTSKGMQIRKCSEGF